MYIYVCIYYIHRKKLFLRHILFSISFILMAIQIVCMYSISDTNPSTLYFFIVINFSLFWCMYACKYVGPFRRSVRRSLINFPKIGATWPAAVHTTITRRIAEPIFIEKSLDTRHRANKSYARDPPDHFNWTQSEEDGDNVSTRKDVPATPFDTWRANFSFKTQTGTATRHVRNSIGPFVKMNMSVFAGSWLPATCV